MITDNLQIELFSNSPTFRNQVRLALLSVAVARWKGATAVITGIDAEEDDAIRAGERLPAGDKLTRAMARAEASFLDEALAKQGVRLNSTLAPQYVVPGQDVEAERQQEITRLIGLLLLLPSWEWTIADWLDSQAGAQAYVNAQVNGMLSAMAAPPNVPAAIAFYTGESA